MDEYEYFDYDNAYFRRLKDEFGGFGGVDDVLVNGKWQPYKGDASAPHFSGLLIKNPVEGAK